MQLRFSLVGHLTFVHFGRAENAFEIAENVFEKAKNVFERAGTVIKFS